MNKYSLEALKTLVNGDEKFFHEMVSVFVSSTHEGFVQMNQACETGGWTRVADAAHKLISPCIHFEANHLVFLLRQIEHNIRVQNLTEPIPGLLKQAEAEANDIIRHIDENHR